MEYVTLSNGVKAPVLGIGTFMISPEDTVNSVYSAIKLGYRLIDTANAYGNEPPTYNCVGTSDGIASYRTMQARIDAIKANGTDAEIEVFQGLSHGFGLGTGTVAEGWLDNAIAFWERNMQKLN